MCVWCGQTYLDSLDPLGDMTEKDFEDYLYEKSLEIQPRHAKQPPKFVSDPRSFSRAIELSWTWLCNEHLVGYIIALVLIDLVI